MPGPVEFLDDESPIPAENSVRPDDARDVLQGLAPEPLGDLRRAERYNGVAHTTRYTLMEPITLNHLFLKVLPTLS